MNRGNVWALNRGKPLPCTVRTSKQRSYNQQVGYMLCSMARINELWFESLDKGKVYGFVPCCGKDGYQTPKHPLDTYKYISHIQDYKWKIISQIKLFLANRLR